MVDVAAFDHLPFVLFRLGLIQPLLVVAEDHRATDYLAVIFRQIYLGDRHIGC